MPEATVAVLIEKEGKLLLTKRNVDPYKEYWVPPGGHIDENETAEAAAIREVKEETSLEIKPKFLFYHDEICSDVGVHHLVLVFSAATDKEAQINEECADFGWFTLEEALKMKLGFRYHDLLKMWSNTIMARIKR